ncbi:hypothetical protein L2747_18845 [Shewanella marinintestina]|uniref:hypothetical protein n=1 Tax=Shewanella marinintestina TaxID=190305 RepID=UPI00200D5C1C|nr:hypothetical protein [Shewanella marinintestina]MCL1148065.1 hypothetical protein [Shewanella marinintestina]
MNKITIIETVDRTKPFTKRFIDGEKISYGRQYRFNFIEREVNSIDELAELITELSNEHMMAVIRGEQIDPTVQNKQRLLNPQKDGTQPTIQSKARNWFMLDVDDYKTDKEPLEAVAEVVAQLPVPVRSADYVVQLSASYTPESPVLKAHIWFLNETPLSSRGLKAIFRKCELVDKALFSDAQVHYTAAPIYEGQDDPVNQRIFTVKQRGRAKLVAPELLGSKPQATVHELREMLTRLEGDELAEVQASLSLIETARSSLDREFFLRLIRRNYQQLRHLECFKLGAAMHNTGFSQEETEFIINQVKDPDSGHDATQAWGCFGNETGKACGLTTLYQFGGLGYSDCTQVK